MFDIRDINNPIGMKAYSLDNYKIEVHSERNNNICYIYFSGNGIYKDSEANFREVLFKKDRYEWDKRRSTIPSKEIFVRDIYKQWYIVGINQRLNSIDKLADFLKFQTEGYYTVCVGVSAGGYIAALIGSLVHADMVIDFSGQFDLSDRSEVNPMLKYFHGGKYCSIVQMIRKNNVPIYYFYPCRCTEDIYQASTIADCSNIRKFSIISSEHGIVLSKQCVEKVISMNQVDLEKLYQKNKGKECSLSNLTIQITGFFGWFYSFVYNTAKKLYRKVK